jgi:predicted enzyme related to lactoylglutathione lyase
VGARVLIRPEDVPWGRRAVVLDPDGRTVELNETADP